MIMPQSATDLPPPLNYRSPLLLQSLSLLLFFAGLTLLSLTQFIPVHKTLLFSAGFVLSFAGMVALRRHWPQHWGLAPLLTLSILARALLLPLAPSDDVNRYVWEGMVQLHQLNPYTTAPSSDKTLTLRDSIWQGINHKHYTSIYGPLAQLLFKGATALWYSVMSVKLLIVVFDITTIVLLASIIRKRKTSLSTLLLYALNPLVLYSFAGEGHVESVMLCMLCASLLLFERRRFGWMFTFLGCAAAVKLTALLFIPLFIRKDTVKYLPMVMVPTLLALPYGRGISSLWTVTREFGTDFQFNGCFFTLFAAIFSNTTALLLSGLVFVAVYCLNFFLTPHPVKASGNVALAFLLTAPTAHPWYFTIIALFAALYPARSWIALTGTVGISWLVIFSYWSSGIWKERLSYWLIEYLPPGFIELATRLGWRRAPARGTVPLPSGAIIIPVLNEAERLKHCLESIQLPAPGCCEIVVVDGGSEDNTVAIAQRDSRVRVISSVKGRGIQIARGVEESVGEIVIILHADSRLEPHAITTILHSFHTHPGTVGGSVASRFSSADLRYHLITALNNFRSRFTGISFGDQVQFFRRSVLQDHLPKVRLMEDIEIALRLKERGSLIVLPSLAQSSTRRWQKRAYSRNMMMVVGLTALYLVKRRLGLLSADNAEFYEVYYGKN